MSFFEIKNIALEVYQYPISWVELIGTLFGLISVYFASRANILTWATGIVNEIFLYILFFQVQLYADMFLQIYFFIVTIYGWYSWNTKSIENKISEVSLKWKIYIGIIILIGSLVSGYIFSNIHLYLPTYFNIKAAYPFTDSLVMVLSIFATILLAKKKIETWYLWITVDIICVVLYFKKEVLFLSIEYFVFLLLATYGFYNWRKELKHG